MGLNFGMLHQFAGAEKSIKVIAAVLYGMAACLTYC